MNTTHQEFGVHQMNCLMWSVVDLKEDCVLFFVIMCLVEMNPQKIIWWQLTMVKEIVN